MTKMNILIMLILAALNFLHGEQKNIGTTNLFPVQVDAKICYIDITGEIVIRLKTWTPIVFADFSEGFAPAFIKDIYFFIDTTGEFVICRPPFAHMSPHRLFHESLAGVELRRNNGGNKWGYIDRSGEVVIQPQFDAVGDFFEGLAPVMTDEKKWGYINKTGEIIILPHFDGARNFHCGLAAVNIGGTQFYSIVKNGKWGYIDKRGTMVIEPRFDYAGDFTERLSPVKIDGKWGYIDTTGKIAIEPIFDCAKNFYCGLAPVNTGGKDIISYGRDYNIEGGKWGYIEETGKFTIETQFDKAFDFSRRLARVKIDGKWGYIDTTGKYIWEPTR